MTIKQALEAIQNESYGEPVRQAIIEGIQLCYSEKATGGYCPVDDLNTYYSGVAFCASSIAHSPFQSSFVIMSAGNSSNCFQAAINITNLNDGYVRKRQNNAWSNWEKLGISRRIRYWNYDGTELLYTERVTIGGNGSWNGTATKESTTQYEYTFVGWNTSKNATTGDSNATKNITANRDVYAAFTQSVRSYNVYFYNGATLLKTASVLYGGNASDSGISTPTKASTAQYDYSFVGWNSQDEQEIAEANVLNNIVSDKSVYAAFSKQIRSYTVSFYIYSGSQLLGTDTVPYGSNASDSGIVVPAKTSTAQYRYVFDGWNSNSGQTAAEEGVLNNITGNKSVYAAYKPVIRTYTVRFMNGTTVLQTVNDVPYGGDATYTGSTPQHPTAPDDYTFIGFDPDGTNIKGATDCNAVYILNPKELRYWNYDGTELLHTELVEVGADGSWNGTSSKPSTTEHSYIFLGWNTSKNASTADANATKNLTADRDVYAAFQETVRSYSVHFYNGTTLLYTDLVQYEDSASYTGSTPTKASSEQYDYHFVGWNSQDGQSTAETGVLDNIVDDKDVYAAFSGTLRQYTVTFMNGATTLGTVTVDYGTDATYSGNTPTKDQTPQYTYTFVGWNSQDEQSAAETGVLNNITADKTIYAAFREDTRYYTVRFMNGETVLQTSQVTYGSDATYTGETPVHPTSPEDWVFARFEPDGTNITEDTDCLVVWREFSDDTRKLVLRSISGSYTNSNATSVGGYAFAYCTSLTTIILPEVSQVGAWAFKNCTSLLFISLPKTEYIGGAAFYFCSSLRSMVIGTDISKVCSIPSNAFSVWNCTFYVPDSKLTEYKQASVWSNHADYIKPVSQLPTA